VKTLNSNLSFTDVPFTWHSAYCDRKKYCCIFKICARI